MLVGMLFTSIAYGQSRTDEELYAIWSDSTKPETERVDAYFERVNLDTLPAGEPEWIKKWAPGGTEALELAIKHDKKGYLPLLYMISIEACAGNQECMCTAASKVIESAKVANAAKLPITFWAYFILIEQCKVDISAVEADMLQEFEKFKRILSDAPADLETLRQIHASIGEVYLNKNQYPKALAYLRESQRISEKLKLIDFTYTRSNQLLSVIHTNTGNFKESEKYITKSLALAHQQKDTFLLGSGLIVMSRLMLKSKNEAQAKVYIDSALYFMRNVEKCDVCYHIAKIVHAGISNLSGEYSAALTELDEVERFSKEENSGFTLEPDFFIEKANAYMGLQRFDDAIRSLSAFGDTAESWFRIPSDKYKILVSAYEAKGDYKRALENYKRYVQTEDSMTVWRNSSEVTRLELENQFTQQQLQTELDFQTQLNQQRFTRNWILFLGTAAFLFAMGLYFRLRFIRKTQKLLEKKNKIIEAEKAKAQASERAKHQFLANMSHEIRTPMNAIKGMTDILIRRNPKEDQQEYLDGIKQSSDSLLVIINDILDISKIEAGKVELEQEPFSVLELVNNVHTIMQFRAEEKGLLLLKEVPENELFVTGDANRLRQILINLIGNAIKFTEKGQVTTSIQSEPAGENLNLHVTVSDTGIGIDPDRMEKIFESFEQAYSDTSRKFGGTGLGLSISKKLVELHGGTIWVETEKGKGSQFHFIIPYTIAVAAQQAILAADLDTHAANTLKGIRILLVEDNAFNVIVAQEELEDAIEGVQVEVAENGLIAVEKLKSATFDVILMDVQMPVNEWI